MKVINKDYLSKQFYNYYKKYTEQISNKLDKNAESLEATNETLNASITEHINNTENPHNVTTKQLGLENVVNTGDSDIPIAGGTDKFTTGGAYVELLKKQDKLTIGNGINITDNEISVTEATTEVSNLFSEYLS